jgi:hypothetical protein
MNEELAKRAIACKHWRWMPGMLVTFPPTVCTCRRNQLVPTVRLIPADIGGCFNIHENGVCGVEKIPKRSFPNLTDPATLGCLLALVREALGDERAHCEHCEMGDLWEVWRHDEGHAPLWISFGETEAEALVSALERKSFPRVTKIVTTPK